MVNTWRLRARDIAGTLLNFAFPPICAVCHTPGELLCKDCLAAMPWVQKPLCARCGRTLAKPAKQCPACSRPSFVLRRVRTAVYFSNPVPAIIHQLKYKGMFALAQPLATMMVKAWEECALPVDLIAPVPLHRQRHQERGYNQAALLARHLGTHLGVSVADEGTIQRVRYTQPQVNLDVFERQANVRNAFVAKAKAVRDKDLLLVDDVYTTGATLSATAQALLEAGANSVSGYCLARAV